MNEWQPIESIPYLKGSLLYGQIDDLGDVSLGWVIGFKEYDGSFYFAGIDSMQPTHWMPLPEGPK